jgi:hypothetical protein
MKTISTLLASLFFSVGVFAAKSNTILTVTSADRSNIIMVLDGKRFEPNDNGIMLQGIDKGDHQIRVYRERNIGMQHVSGRRYEIVYNTVISMKNNTHLFITVERNGRISMSESKIKNGYMQDDGYGYNNGGGKWGGYDQHEAYTVGMSDRDFDNVLNQIDKEWLESNKLKSAINVVRNNSISAAQVKELLLLFSFENNKLELAKQAYASTVDKRNYEVVFGVFSFAGSKAELDRYIRNYR